LREPFAGQLGIALVCFPALLLKGMKYIDGGGDFCDIKYSPLAKHMNADFLCTGTY
jgi:hypothetical protein